MSDTKRKYSTRIPRNVFFPLWKAAIEAKQSLEDFVTTVNTQCETELTEQQLAQKCYSHNIALNREHGIRLQVPKRANRSESSLGNLIDELGLADLEGTKVKAPVAPVVSVEVTDDTATDGDDS